ncbi:glycosyltransferase family 4 protein [Metabacillus malikii]|uniref:Glycosyltransferase involved in cell wall biosynthesis n=1 Tax=Metabacillus malikii TaxID=1504265 RepID=A0ABT9ZFW3_9BACI|nr:glycosyltransferase family 1 protein [Metabacillus malikii]MDQ0231151.1 glycosyltransferase involved in cell wall biosynthesis [Metabacillus malikii]
MRIAIFTDTFAPDVNGVARTLKRLTDYFEKRGYEYRVFAPESTSESRFSSHIHRFTSLPFFLYPECRLALPNMLHVKAELLRFKPDLIHVATPFNIGLCGLHYAKKLNIPIVGSYHTDFDQYLDYYDLQFLSKFLWKYMHWFHRPLRKIFVPSYETMEQLKRKGFSNLRIWGRGVDCSLFHPNYDKHTTREKFQLQRKFTLTYVGRLAPEKDIETLMKLARQLPEPYNSQIEWVIVGDGPSKEEMMKNAPANMTFAGYLNGKQLAEMYSYSDLFIFPSPTETFGNVVLEALAAGTPVVCANSGGVKNIIKHDVTGILCEPKNVDQFKQAIIQLLSNEEQRVNMGKEARSYALTQSWDHILEGLLKEYVDTVREMEHIRYA